VERWGEETKSGQEESPDQLRKTYLRGRRCGEPGCTEKAEASPERSESLLGGERCSPAVGGLRAAGEYALVARHLPGDTVPVFTSGSRSSPDHVWPSSITGS
jgi:hypothetical protein